MAVGQGEHESKEHNNLFKHDNFLKTRSVKDVNFTAYTTIITQIDKNVKTFLSFLLNLFLQRYLTKYRFI